MGYQINDYIIEDNKKSEIYPKLYLNMQDVFKEKRIEIMSAYYIAKLDGNTTTIPIRYAPEDYKLPNFVVAIKENEKK